MTATQISPCRSARVPRSLQKAARAIARPDMHSSLTLGGKEARGREKTRTLSHRALSNTRSTSRWTMEVTWNHYYGSVQKLSLLTGIWPFLNARAKFFRLGVLTVIMVSTLVPQVNLSRRESGEKKLVKGESTISFQFAHQFKCGQDLQCICETMTSYLLTGVAALKVYTFVVNSRKVRPDTSVMLVSCIFTVYYSNLTIMSGRRNIKHTLFLGCFFRVITSVLMMVKSQD